MKEVIRSIFYESALILTAPPGWGKTYKILTALKETKKKTVFVFPLRALCEEVYTAAIKKEINVCLFSKQIEYEFLIDSYFDLIITTPECLSSLDIEILSKEYLFIFDEAHLYFYWGEYFRPRMQYVLEGILTYAPPCIFLSATLNIENLKKLESTLDLNYKNIYHFDMGNQKLSNNPTRIFYYFKHQQKRVLKDIEYSKKSQTSLVFCSYRSQVESYSHYFKEKGFIVLSCVGGEAKEFCAKLAVSSPDIIIATTVISHGVNLPNIDKIYFLNKVENIDFYLQMLGRAGRNSIPFELHTFNREYLSYSQVLKGLLASNLKRISNKVKSFL